tara:strand:+ start:449 stop:814 length:366 start_codon:yes stop_codon:yes gene_type:complete
MQHFRHVLPALEVDLIGFPMEWADEECDMVHGDAPINFTVNIEAREYGIKSIYTSTDRISILIGDKHLIINQFDPITINGELVEGHSTWDIVDEIDLEQGMIVPERVEIDWKSRKAWVYYG